MLRSSNTFDFFDADGIAFFKEACFGDGSIGEAFTSNHDASKKKRSSFPLKLFQAITMAESGAAHGTYSSVDVPPATKVQVDEFVRWYAEAMVERFWEIPDLLSALTDTTRKAQVLLSFSECWLHSFLCCRRPCV